MALRRRKYRLLATSEMRIVRMIADEQSLKKDEDVKGAIDKKLV